MNYDSQRWVTLFSCMAAGMCSGFAYAWSIFQKPLISLYNWSAADVSLSFTLIMSTAATTAIFAGKALDYTHSRQVVLIGGVLLGAGIITIGYIQSLTQLYICAVVAGIGVGAVYPGGTMTNIIRFFPDRRGMVSGLLAAGYGLGGVVWAPVSAALISQYGVLAALKILGIVFLGIISIVSRAVQTAPEGYRPRGWIPVEGNLQTSLGVNKSWQEMLRDPVFYLVAAIFTLGGVTGMMIIGHASPIAQELLAMTPQAAAGVVGLLLVANTAGKVYWGWISDKIGRYSVVVILFVLGAAAMAALPMVTGYFSIVGMILTVGLCYGGFLAIMAPITADLFGTKNLGVNFGIMFLTIAVAAYVGPLLAAVVKQTNHGDYTQAFIIAAGINLMGLVLFGVFAIYKRKTLSLPKET